MNQPKLIEFHDAVVASIVVERSGLRIEFEHVSCYYSTEMQDVYDVMSCKGSIRVDGARDFSCSLSLGGERIVASDGSVVVDGAEVGFSSSLVFEGCCQFTLSFLIGEDVKVAGGRIEFRINSVGRTIGRFHGRV
ncbi:MAG: hypothetical protein Q8N26_04100 [Myxococcales bacterium]|nr:hypothetical protein [Myxococcales bacterium]